MDKEIEDLINAEIKEMKSNETGEIVIVQEDNLPTTEDFMQNSTVDVISDTKGKILTKAQYKINKEKMIERHAESLSKVADKSLEVDIETEKNKVLQKQANNKAEKQEIKNRLIVLTNEAKRLKKEEKHKNKLQKIRLKNEKKEEEWNKLKGTLEPLGYSYVPNFLCLYILLFLNGVKAFFNAVSEVSDALLKALKWIIFIVIVLTIILIVPVTRAWILGLLGFIK